MMERGGPRDNGSTGGRPERLSYKFQRLREAIRHAIECGELPNRLPGERELGRRFGANAKTINKALSDLTAEGLLVRRIGRGTFRAGTAEALAENAGRRAYAFADRGGNDRPVSQVASALARVAAAEGWDLQMLEAVAPQRGAAIVLNDWPAASRKDTQALVFVSGDALSRDAASPAADLVLEAHRRHVPMVSLGSSPADIKLHGVVPDYGDAGYRAAEHLYRLGCESVLVFHAAANREVECVLNGCRTAASRFGGRCTVAAASPDSAADAAAVFAGAWAEETRRNARNQSGAAIGVLMIGAASHAAVWTHGGLAAKWNAGEAAVACIRDLGETAGDHLPLTAYEFDAAAAAKRAIDLCGDISVGQRPVELILPGRLVIRETIATPVGKGREPRPELPATSGVVRSPSAEVSI